jgi:4-hydroxyphenylacetate 3-monooxygenase
VLARGYATFGKRAVEILLEFTMLKTGREHLEGLRNGRVVYVGEERIADVVSHPAFRRAARSIADLYDMKCSSANRESMSFVGDGEKASAYFLRARTKEDLQKRSHTHRKIAGMSYGLLGRSPDYVASFVTGMATNPELFGKYSENIRSYYRHMVKNDVFAAHAVIPPQAAGIPFTISEKTGHPRPFAWSRRKMTGSLFAG